ncbi:TPA: cyclase family protein [Candidatus Poribacteria bacterium]|nr:cyclase family protein [Candidatus Poribacteria bacterium]
MTRNGFDMPSATQPKQLRYYERKTWKENSNMQLNFKRIIDLSYPIDENSPCELPIEPARIYDTATMEEDGYFESRVDLSGHYSTHTDTPSLMYASGFTIDQIPLEKLSGMVTLMNFSRDKKPGDEITEQEITNWMAEHDDIAKDSIVFLYTGMQEYAYQPIFNRKWIGLSGEAAKLLCDKGIKIVGTDAPSIDSLRGHDIQFPAHHTFLEHEIPIVEDICNLDKLPQNFYALIAPLKLCKSSGAPTRVFAFV